MKYGVPSTVMQSITTELLWTHNHSDALVVFCCSSTMTCTQNR